MSKNTKFITICALLAAIVGALIGIAHNITDSKQIIIIKHNTTILSNCHPDGGLMDLCRISTDCPNYAGNICND